MSSCSGRPTTVVAMLDAAMAANAVRPALHYQGGTVTYGAFAERVRRAAGLLAAQGVGPGDRVALMARNGLAYFDVYLAAAYLRAAAVPVDALLEVAGRRLQRARTFSDVPEGAAFWYENANGLAEIAVNRGRAADVLNLGLGDAVGVAT